jgi:hypothetical protein
MASRGLYKCSVLLGYGCQAVYNSGKCFIKPLVKVVEPDEGTKII